MKDQIACNPNTSRLVQESFEDLEHIDLHIFGRLQRMNIENKFRHEGKNKLRLLKKRGVRYRISRNLYIQICFFCLCKGFLF